VLVDPLLLLVDPLLPDAALLLSSVDPLVGPVDFLLLSVELLVALDPAVPCDPLAEEDELGCCGGGAELCWATASGVRARAAQRAADSVHVAFMSVSSTYTYSNLRAKSSREQEWICLPLLNG